MGKFVVKYRWFFVSLFAIFLVASTVLLPKMIHKVNYDLTSYLPAGYSTLEGYKFLKHFNIHGDIEVGVNTDEKTVRKIADELKKINGVTTLIWADQIDYLHKLGIYDLNNQAERDKFLKLRRIMTDAPLEASNGKYNYVLLMGLSSPPSNPESIKIFKETKKILQKYAPNSFSLFGMTEQANALFDSVFNEIIMYMLIGGIVVLIILGFTTSSLAEPIILILTLTISILINLATNALFKSTSIITFACTAILQLGLSMDYAIFLLHKYRDELKKTSDAKTALANAIPKSGRAILTSALTTIGGLLSLLAMKFTIGYDLGLSLAKGIFCSCLTVLFLQPALMLMLDKARIYTAHKALNVHFKYGIKKSIQGRHITAIILLLLFFPMFFATKDLKYTYVHFLPKHTEQSVHYKMAETLGNQVMFMLPTTYVNEDGSTEYLIEKNYNFLKKLEQVENVDSVLGLYSQFPENATIKGAKVWQLIEDKNLADKYGGLKPFLVDSSNKSIDYSLKDVLQLSQLFANEIPEIKQLFSNGYTIYTIGINPKIDIESDECFKLLDKIQKLAEEEFNGYGKIYSTGIARSAYDFAKVTPGDLLIVTLVSIAVVLLLLIVSLKKIKLSFLIVALIQFGIWLNLVLQFITGGTINFMAYLFITAIQLGATVDYGILVTTKYLKNRERYSPTGSAYMATQSSVMSILTSALIMAGACLSVYFVSSNLVVKEMTLLIARGSIISTILVLFLLPALLILSDKKRVFDIAPKGYEHIRRSRYRTKVIRRYINELPSLGSTVPTRNKKDFTKISGEELLFAMQYNIDITDDKKIHRFLRNH